ncbi:MAG: hypothetical protein GY750_07865 [Lentisphaerae bacterium]|nr:hypothetical protein [Lentisphaerota bacterium]MCP4101323.1 hypothetical protein [Lentisphaerota bacterium]
MKKMLAALALSMMAVTMFAADLISFVPNDAQGLVYLDVSRLINLQQVKDIRTKNKDFNNQWLDFEKSLQPLGLQLKDMPSEALMFFRMDQSQFGIVAKSKINEAKLVSLLKTQKMPNGKKAEYTVQTIAGRKVYIIKTDEDLPVGKGPKEEVAVTFLKPDVVLLTEKPQVNAILSGMGKGPSAKLSNAVKQIKRPALAWMVCEQQPPKAPQGQPGQPVIANPMSSIKSIGISLDLTGKDQKDLSLNADVECINAQSASSLAMQLNGLMMMFVPQGFAGDPQLGSEVAKSIKLRPENSNVKIDVSVPELLLNKIQKYLEQRQKMMAPQVRPVQPIQPPAPAAAPAQPKAK